ncbi:hypothetical protein B0H11DRAFT_2250104 [Mycena galericulata]|nr:hypothetical protein B0H11DRAFT_2250104 [Mycena galericulata]
MEAWTTYTLNKVRMARNVKVWGGPELALASLYSPPDNDLLRSSYNTVWSYEGPKELTVIKERFNQTQLLEKVADLKKQVNNLKLETVDLKRSLASAREDVAEYKAIFHYLGNNTVPGLHRMFPNALKQRWGSKQFLERSRAASRGEYTPENFTQYEIDLAILLYEVGGGSAVYAMNHSIFALPSLNTLQPYRRQHRPKPCLDHVDVLTISENISTMFGPHEEKGGKSREVPIKICGHTLMFDELATERRIDYMSTTDQMAGFCLEHVDALPTLLVGKDTQTVEAAVTAVKEGKDYGAKPVFIGPTCKKGNWRSMLETIQCVLEAWKHSPDGGAKHGPIQNIASDGYYGRRIALFMLCMHSEIIPGNPLYPLICNLRGFNRRVGNDNITMDMDYRHLFKRICTLLCSWMGMLVKSVCVSRDLLVLWLERLTSHDWSEMSIENLLHPTDAQNVSRAVKLLLCIVEIRTLDKDSFDPSEEAEFEALGLLGESNHIPRYIRASRLYGDFQAMVKAAILMVAKTRVLDPRLDILLCLLGDNIPSRPFLAEVACAAWTGEISAGSSDIEACYDSGVDAAEGKLRKYSVLVPKSFAEHFQKKDTDLLRPFGGKYPALSPEIDRSIVNASPPSDSSRPDTESNPVFQFNFEARLADDKVLRAARSDDHHSIFAAINSEGQLCHKKAIVRTFFDMTQNNHSNHDRLQRIRGFTIGGKTWEREETDSENVSSSAHFQLGNLFVTFVCYNGTYLGLALAKSTLIKRGLPGSKSPSISAIPIAELSLPSSPYTVCGQIFSLVPLTRNGSEWAWDGKFVSLSVKKKGKQGLDDPSRLQNLQLSVSSRLIDPIMQNDRRDVLISELGSTGNDICFNSEREKTWVFSSDFILAVWYRIKERIESDSTLHDKIPVYGGVHDGVFPYQAGPTESSPGVTYAFSIVSTAIFDAIANCQACRVCGKSVNDTDIQTHMGKHIRKALRNVHDESVKCPVAEVYPCGTCGRSMDGGTCQQSKEGQSLSKGLFHVEGALVVRRQEQRSPPSDVSQDSHFGEVFPS